MLRYHYLKQKNDFDLKKAKLNDFSLVIKKHENCFNGNQHMDELTASDGVLKQQKIGLKKIIN